MLSLSRRARRIEGQWVELVLEAGVVCLVGLDLLGDHEFGAEDFIEDFRAWILLAYQIALFEDALSELSDGG